MITIKTEMPETKGIIKAILDNSSLKNKVTYKYQGWKTNKGDRFAVKINKPGTVDLVGLEDMLGKYGDRYDIDFHVEYPHEKNKDVFWIEAKPSMEIQDVNGKKLA